MCTLTLSLNIILQTENQDFAEAVKLINTAKDQLEHRRQNSIYNFNTIFQSVKEIRNKYGMSVVKSIDFIESMTSRQTNSTATVTDTVENFYTIRIYILTVSRLIYHLP